MNPRIPSHRLPWATLGWSLLVAAQLPALPGTRPVQPVRANDAATSEVEEEVVLRVGQAVEGEITKSSEVVHTRTIDAQYSTYEPVRGVRFLLDVETGGPVTIDLRSHLFDAYLVLEDVAAR